jgi:DNA-binding YbaB/EbfC family protein
MVNMNQLMQQAQAMQEKIKRIQSELAAREYTGEAGGKMVLATLSGKGEPVSIKIDPSICNEGEVEILEDLVITAFKNAKKKLDADAENTMSSVVPAGFKMPF